MFPSVGLNVPVADRVAAIAATINAMLEMHDSGESTLGVESFCEDLIGRIEAA